MAASEEWAHRPKPQVGQKAPVDINDPSDLIGRQKMMCDVIRLALEAENIESRPVWKPLHLQPLFEGARYFGKGVSDYNSTMIDRAGGDDGVNAMVDLIHKYVYVDRPREKAAPSIINGTMRLNEGSALNVASVRDQLEWFQSEGLVDASITLDTLLDTSYVKTIGA